MSIMKVETISHDLTEQVEYEPVSVDDICIHHIIKCMPSDIALIRQRLLAKHGRTMLMMYKATGEVRYLNRARQDEKQAKLVFELVDQKKAA